MLSRVKELYYEYCTPKPKYHFNLWDAEKVSLLTQSHPTAMQEREGIDIYVHLVL